MILKLTTFPRKIKGLVAALHLIRNIKLAIKPRLLFIAIPTKHRLTLATIFVYFISTLCLGIPSKLKQLQFYILFRTTLYIDKYHSNTKITRNYPTTCCKQQTYVLCKCE